METVEYTFIAREVEAVYALIQGCAATTSLICPTPSSNEERKSALTTPFRDGTVFTRPLQPAVLSIIGWGAILLGSVIGPEARPHFSTRTNSPLVASTAIRNLASSWLLP